MIEAGVAVLTVIVGIITSIFKTFKFVKEGERGCVLRFGKLNRIREPGFIILIPWVETLDTIHVRETTSCLPQQTVALKDNYIINVNAVLIYRVVDAQKALYNISGIHESIRNVAMTVLRHELSLKNYEEVKEFDKINDKLLSDLKELTESWGVHFKEFKISDLDPDQKTTELLLFTARAEKQVEANKILLSELEEIIKSQASKSTSLQISNDVLAASWFGQSATPVLDLNQ